MAGGADRVAERIVAAQRAEAERQRILKLAEEPDGVAVDADAAPSNQGKFFDFEEQAKRLERFEQQEPLPDASQVEFDELGPSFTPQSAIGAIPRIDPRPNILDQYASYTYNISLYALSVENYNNLVDNSTLDNRIPGEEILSHLLISSGGINNSNRDEFFGEDFYIDDLSLMLIPGTTTRSRNTNAINIDFKIFEPYGVTLLDRLFKIAKEILDEGNQMIHMPYLLRIDFKGYKDDGSNKKIPDATRWIPLKIHTIDFKVTGGGAEYSVGAYPFNSSAFDPKIITIRNNVEITARTIGEVFTSGLTSIVKTPTERDAFSAEEQDVDAGKLFDIKLRKHNSIVEFLNFYEKDAATNKPSANSSNEENSYTTVRHRYDIKIDPEIKDARIMYKNEKDTDLINRLPMIRKKTERMEQYYQNLIKKIKISEKNLVTINGGTTLDSIMNILIPYSTYIENQINLDGADLEGKTLRWYRINPTVKILEWDKKRRQYAYDIVYHIIPSNIFGLTFPGAPKGKMIGAHKTYNYIYSGENINVINFDIQFNLGYYETMTIGTRENRRGITAQKGDGAGTTTKDSTRQDHTGGLVQTRERNFDLFDKIMAEGYDLVNLDLEIIGDPAYIIQNAIFYQQPLRNGDVLEEPFLPDGSVNYDYSDLFINIKFNSPRDYNPESGLATKTTTSSFSGRYKITQIDSIFSNGKFTQTLRGLRMEEQDSTINTAEIINEEDERNSESKNDNRPVSAAISQVAIDPTAIEDAEDINLINVSDALLLSSRV